MSIGLFNFRKLSRPLFVLLGLLSLASSLFIFSPSTNAQSSGASGRCENQGGVPCVILHVKIDPYVAGATIVLNREGNANNDEEFFLYNGTNDGSGVANDGKIASSGDVIWGTAANGPFCKTAPQPDEAFFNITVRGTATGELKHQNMCANAGTKASGNVFDSDSGAPAQVKTLTVNVTAANAPSKKGGIKGKVALKTDDGKTVKCESSSAIDVTNKKTNKKTSYPIGDGSWSTGLVLDPGTYDVYVNCIGQADNYPINYKDIVVKAGEFSDVGSANCSVTEVDKCDPGEQKDDTGAERDLCPIKAWEFRWAACPIVSALYGTDGQGGVMGLLQDWGVKNLAINIDEIFDNKQYYAAWNSFRVIAVSLIIVAGLIMVVSQAANMEIFDTYTIRKLLPRLLVVAIIISISWWLLEYIVLFFNNLMIWVGSAIEAPFNEKIEPLSAGAMAAQIAAVIVASTLVNPAMIISYLTTITLAWAVATLALAVRKMIIVFLILTSPIFLFFSIFNGTQGLYKTGQTGLISLLAIGIVFNGALELGYVMAALTPKESDPFGILRLGFQIAGLLIIPVALMRLGGMASTLTGLVNDRSKGAFDKLKLGRAEQRAGLINKMKTGDRWKDSNVIGNALNKTTRGAYNARNVGLNPMAMKRRFQASSDQGVRTAANNILASDEYKAIADYDDANRAGKYDGSADALTGLTREFQAEGRKDAAGDARRAVAAVEASGNVIGNQAFRMASAMQLVTTGTGYKNIQEMSQRLAQAAGGNESTASALAGWANFQTKKVGRNDLAPGAGKLSTLVKQEAGFVTRSDGSVVRPTANDYIDAGYEAMMGASNSDVVRMKTLGITHGTGTLAAVAQRSQNVLNSNASTAQKARAQEMLINATAKIENAKAAAPYGSETNILAIQQAAAPVQHVTNEIKLQAAPATSTYDARQVIQTKDASGNTINVPNPRYGQRNGQVHNDGYVPEVGEAYNNVLNSRGGNPYDDMNMRQ